MAEVRTKEFKTLAADTLSDGDIQKHLKTLYSGFNQGRLQQAAATHNWEELRDRARRIKAHTIENLDHYLNMAADNVEKAGGKVFFAKDSDAATKYVLDLAKQKGVRSVIKGKSMLSEEMDLNHHLAKQEIEAVETDLGEYLVQLAGQTPYHIIVPAIHMSKSDVNELFHENLGVDPNAGVEELASAARNELRGKFIQADMGITGANFLVAETGTLVLVTNEGNGRMSTSMPKTHVAIMGMEKIVPSIEDMGTFLRLLIRSATGQRISSYVTMVTGPRSECRGGRARRVPSRHRRQRTLEAPRRPPPARGSVLHPLRRVPERLPRLPQGGWTLVWLGLLRSHRRGRLPRAHQRPRRQGPPLCIQPVRRVQRGLPHQDRPAAYAPLPAKRGHRGQYRPKPQEVVTDREAHNESLEGFGKRPRDAATRWLDRSIRPNAICQERTAAPSAPSSVRLDATPELPRDIVVPLPSALEEGDQALG